MQINGRSAIVAGGASGMTRATAERIAAGGGTVAILDRQGTAGPEVAASIGGTIPDEFAAALTRDAAFSKRMGKPDEYARLACAIIENPMVSGGTIRLDAGQRFAPK